MVRANHMLQDLIEDLKRDEGFRSHPYRDTVGKLTVGYGRNLDDVGISEPEAAVLLSHDIGHAIEEVHREFPWSVSAPIGVKRGLYNMAFNMGINRLSGFKRMLRHLQEGNYAKAADEALDSKWATQVGARASRIAYLFRQS